MTQDLLVNTGEEYYTVTALDGVSLTVGLYDDTVDSLDDTSDLDAITSDPDASTTAYAEVTDTFTARAEGGNWGIHNDSDISFDFSDVATGDGAAQDLDTAFVYANFDSTEAGDGGTAADHLIGNPALSQIRNTGEVDSIDIAAGALDINID